MGRATIVEDMAPSSLIPHRERQEGRAACSNSSLTGSSCASNASRITPDFEKENVHDLFELGDTIDRGEHWEMVKAAPKAFPANPTPTMAIKKFGCWHLRRGRTNAFLREVNILKELSHPHVLKIHHFFPREFRYYYAVLEHLEGEELIEYIGKKDYFDKKMLWTICYTIIDTIGHVHEQGIVHRDISPRSFVLAAPGDINSIRLTSFGEACSLRNGPVNTPICWYADRFVAPEILKKKLHGSAVDMWNIGHVMYVLSTGNDLYFKRGEIQVKTKTENKENRMDQNWGNTSEEAKDLILQLLEKDPKKRMTAKEAAKNLWIRSGIERMDSKNLTGNIQRIWLSNIKRKCKMALRLYLAGRLLSNGLVANVEESGFLRAYEIQELLGKGSFSRVHKVRLKEGGAELETERDGFGGERTQSEEKEFAAKQIRKSKRVFDEVCILKKLDHENVVKIHDFYTDDPKYDYIVLDLVRGGDLFHHIGGKTDFNEQMVRDTCRVLFKAVEYIHSKGIVHRDLKPENILLASEGESTSIRIVDFGFARCLKGHHSFDCCGTPWYMAPEIIENKSHEKPVDMWSLGVIVYIMLNGGQFPFGNHKNQNRKAGGQNRKAGVKNRVGPRDARQYFMFEIMTDIMDDIKGDLSMFEQPCWRPVSEDAKDFIQELLIVDPSKRLTAMKAVNHPWLEKEGVRLASNDLTCSLNNLRLFNARRKLRGAINMVLATNGLGFDHQKQGGDQPNSEDDQNNMRKLMKRQPNTRRFSIKRNE